MSDILVRIKRAVLAGHFIFTQKAQFELDCDGLTDLDVVESIVNAVAIYKKLRSTNPNRQGREYLYVIQSPNLEGIAIYSKGKLVSRGGIETYCFLVSSKRAT